MYINQVKLDTIFTFTMFVNVCNVYWLSKTWIQCSHLQWLLSPKGALYFTLPGYIQKPGLKRQNLEFGFRYRRVGGKVIQHNPIQLTAP